MVLVTTDFKTTDFKVHSTDTAPEASRAALEATTAKYGFLPNLFGVFAESPAALEAYAAIGNALEKATLSPQEQQVVTIAISVENDCTYCVGAHSTVAGMVGLDSAVLDAVRDGGVIADPKLEALRNFAVAVVRERGRVTGPHLDAFYAAGYDRAAALDVLTVNALKSLSNYTNHIADTPLDDAFQPQAWSRVTV